ncbi:PKD domain-containing protein [Atribacter sp.]|uniref:InlB B-repeat-containing protein n=1 Tax=Atribacter sp. TaxID=2847780 RepID=UPI00345EAFB9
MNRKKLWLLILTTVILTSFISGCIGGGQFGAPSTGGSVTIKGIVVAPENNCFTDACSNPSIIEGEPLPNADIILQGDTHTLTGKTDCAGNYQISGLTDDGYILYANRGEVWIKKALSPVTGDGGEANYITTAQVILWEVIENTNPGAIAIKDIPTAIPFDAIPQEFIDAVKAALADCRDAQKDPTCLALAKDIAVANFGAPCGCIEPTSTPKPAPNCPIPTAVIGVPQPVEGSDGEFKFDTSGSKAGRTNLKITKYQWDFGDGETLETAEPIVQHKYSETGTYQVTLVIVNSCGSSSASVGVSITYQKTITYTLTTTVSPDGSGTVSGAGIYNAGSLVEVTATPTAGYQFVNWTGDVANPNSASTTVTMNGNKTVTAVFTLDLCCELVNRFSIQRNYWGYKHFEWKYYFKGNIENPCRKWLTVEIQLIKDGVVIDSDTKTAHGNNFDTGSIVLDSGESDWDWGHHPKGYKIKVIIYDTEGKCPPIIAYEGNI